MYDFVPLLPYSPQETWSTQQVHEVPMSREDLVRKGLSSLLRAYIPNVGCDKLVHDPCYECIARGRRHFFCFDSSLYPATWTQAVVDPRIADKPYIPPEVLYAEQLAQDPAALLPPTYAGGVVAGTCYRVWPADATGGAFIELSLFAVDYAHQGKGLGAALMRRLESQSLNQHGAETILAYADNHAFAFFSRLGFTRTVTTPFAHWKPKITDYSLGAVVAEKKLPIQSQRAEGILTASPRPIAHSVASEAASSGVSRSSALAESIRASRAVATGVRRCTSGRPNCYCRSGRTRAIIRYDPKTGEALEEYCSTSDAARKLNLTSPTITHVLSGNKEDANGHKFRYAVEVSWIREGGARAIIEVDPETGGVIAEFASAAQAARDTGLSNSSIGMVCSGKLDDVDGRVFRYKEPRIYPCAVCGTDHDASTLLLCDGLDGRCVSTAHTYCIGLEAVPENDWFCESCMEKGEHRKDKESAAAASKAAILAKRNLANRVKATSMHAVSGRHKSGRHAHTENKSMHAAQQATALEVNMRKVEVNMRKGKGSSSKPSNRKRRDINDDECATCGDGGDLLCCDNCPRSYHLECASLEFVPKGAWRCDVCNAEATRMAASRKRHKAAPKQIVQPNRSLKSPGGNGLEHLSIFCKALGQR